MPGYKIEKFENLSEIERHQYNCSLCQNILCNPLVAQCCQQLFCVGCIKDWLKNNDDCPYDRKTMAPSGLSLTPRILLDMLGQLKIHCDYNDNGCNEVLLLENLTKHTVECEFTVKNCKICLCEIQDKSSHDCIKTLLELNQKANEELKSIKDSAKLIKPIVAQTIEHLAQTNTREDSLHREISEMKMEREINLKTIQELREITIHDMLIKLFSNSTHNQTKRLESIEGSEKLIKPIVAQTIEQLGESNTREDSLQSEISEMKMEREINLKTIQELRTEREEFLKTIHELSKNNLREDSLQSEICQIDPENDHSLKDDLRIKFDIQGFSNEIKNWQIKREINITETNMSENMKSYVKNILSKVIDTLNSLNNRKFCSEMPSELKKLMEKRYIGKWQCYLHQFQYPIYTFVLHRLSIRNK